MDIRELSAEEHRAIKTVFAIAKPEIKNAAASSPSRMDHAYSTSLMARISPPKVYRSSRKSNGSMSLPLA